MCLLVQHISYMYMHIQYPCNTHLTRLLFNICLAHAEIAYTETSLRVHERLSKLCDHINLCISVTYDVIFLRSIIIPTGNGLIRHPRSISGSIISDDRRDHSLYGKRYVLSAQPAV